MVRLVAPNGVAFDASEADAPRLLAAGYTEGKPKKEEKAVKKQPKKDKE